jgi:hypothetical protein
MERLIGMIRISPKMISRYEKSTETWRVSMSSAGMRPSSLVDADYSEAGSIGFKRLSGYILGGNTIEKNFDDHTNAATNRGATLARVIRHALGL